MNANSIWSNRFSTDMVLYRSKDITSSLFSNQTNLSEVLKNWYQLNKNQKKTREIGLAFKIAKADRIEL